MDHVESLDRLHASLARRETPETVAGWVLHALPPEADHVLVTTLSDVSRKGARAVHGWSSMNADFRAPDGMERQVAKATELAHVFLGESLSADDPDELEAFVEAFSRLIGREPGKGDFRTGRLGKDARFSLGGGISGRRYNKMFRLAGRLEDRLARLRREEAKFRLTLVGKAALAPDLTRADVDHLPTAAFVAYLSARMKLRSEFTNGSQQRPFDHVAEALLGLCERDAGTNWLAVAHVFPRADVLARLDDGEKGRILGKWLSVLDETATLLEGISSRTKVSLDTMVVRRGNDSTTWNLLAGAWNRSRDNWVAVVTALGMDQLLDSMLPGKVMRLMAGDVVQWHGSGGGQIHPDTRVWAELPKPWEVLRGRETCTRAMVEEACLRHGVDAAKSGWSRPRARTEVAEYRPTPELVHGVTVSNPHMAAALRGLGYFSGKSLKVGHLEMAS